ncbi:hypothetical protein [Streptomyces sp. NPDC056049]|uniref:hypothetical protein n=1 Tax=Streptomyces sp. NPDC056049 TaxID=3345693 RepID=UPI0035E31855
MPSESLPVHGHAPRVNRQWSVVLTQAMRTVRLILATDTALGAAATRVTAPVLAGAATVTAPLLAAPARPRPR